MESAAYTSKESEYWLNVATQEEIPLAGSVTEDVDLAPVGLFLAGVTEGMTEGEFHDYLATRLVAEPELMHMVRRFVGVSDKRMYLELSYRFSRESDASGGGTLCGCAPHEMNRHQLSVFVGILNGTRGEQNRILGARAIASYMLGKGLYTCAKTFASLDPDSLEIIYTSLVLPKEIQQAAAKRRGHGAEHKLAELVHALGVAMIPANKHANPMGATDPNLTIDTFEVAPKQKGSTYSFDLILLDSEGDKRVIVQALIHTSDPGQYGVNKSDETVLVKDRLDAFNAQTPEGSPIELWGLVDGVGFSENKVDTINKLLGTFDHFIQLKTLYKAGLRLHSLGLTSIKAIEFSADEYSAEQILDIANLYVPNDVNVVIGAPAGVASAIPAGSATLYL